MVGTDGSGKSTVTQALHRRLGYPTRVIYMGLNSARVNVRLSLAPVVERAVGIEGGDFRSGNPRRRGYVWNGIRLLYRVLEESLRFLTVAYHKALGRVVLMDRHFRFDHALITSKDDGVSERLHRLYLEHLTPMPDLVILLDVPSTVAMERSREGSMRYHDKRRSKLTEAASSMPNMARIDATKEIEAVVAEAERLIEDRIRMSRMRVR